MKPARTSRAPRTRCGRGLAFGGVIATALLACTDADHSIFVLGVLAPPEGGASGGACVYPAVASGPFLSRGVVDVAFTTRYSATLLVANQLETRQNRDLGRAETSRVSLQGAEVRVTDESGTELESARHVASGSVDAARGGQPWLTAFTVELVSSNALSPLVESVRAAAQANRTASTRLIVSARVFGETSGGMDVESNELRFPIDVCFGCLPFFPAEAVSEDAPPPNCLGTGGSQATAPCVLGQDQAIDCRLCQGNPVCDPAQR